MIAYHPIAKSIQGGLAALSLISILPPVVEFDRIQILRFTHAIVFGWNEIIEAVGNYIGEFPQFFPLSSYTINLLIITASFQIPAFIKYRDKLLQARPLQPRTPQEIFYYYSEYMNLCLLCLSSSTTILFFLTSILVDYKADALGLAIDLNSIATHVTTGNFYFWHETQFNNYLIGSQFQIHSYFQFILCYSIFYLIQFKNYRDGLFLVLGFLLFMEILYIANLPGLPHLVDDFACQFSRDFDLNCALPADANKAN